MRLKIAKGYNRFIAFLLWLLGIGSAATLNSCDINAGGGFEYGTPHADFKINGIVSNQENTKIPGIKVKVEYDSTYTDSNGEYNISIEAFPTDQNFSVQFSDVDGDENGNYQTLDTTVVFINPEFENGDGWYEGETSEEFDVQLKAEN